MNTKKILIVSDTDYQHYWNELIPEIRNKIGSVDIVLDKDISRRSINGSYDVIAVDVSNIEVLYRLIAEIHHGQPRSRIIIVSSTPTWKVTREVLRLGAANVIRKSSKLDEVIDELRRS